MSFIDVFQRGQLFWSYFGFLFNWMLIRCHKLIELSKRYVKITCASSTIGHRNSSAQHAGRPLNFAEVSISVAIGSANQTRRICNRRFNSRIVRWTCYRACYTVWHQVLVLQTVLSSWTLYVLTGSWTQKQKKNKRQKRRGREKKFSSVNKLLQRLRSISQIIFVGYFFVRSLDANIDNNYPIRKVCRHTRQCNFRAKWNEKKNWHRVWLEMMSHQDHCKGVCAAMPRAKMHHHFGH